jgi:hypothetical protein
MQQLQALPNSVFLQPEFVTTAVPVAFGASGTLQLQNISGTASAGSNIATLTFTAAHGYTATLQANGTTLIQNTTTNHIPTPYGGVTNDPNWLLAQVTGATVDTAINGVTFPVIAIPSTTTMLIYCTLTGTNPTVTAASFVPVFALQYGDYNVALGANCAVEYNPDNTGSPILPPSTAAWPAPTFRTLQAVSTTAQLEFDGAAAQTIVVASGAAGTSRWSLYWR